MNTTSNTKHVRATLGSLAIAGLLLAATGAQAQVPPRITYQGEVTVNGTNYTGKAVIRAALVEVPPFGFITTHWSNDDSSAGGSQPILGTTVFVEDGRFIVALGDDSLLNMVPIPTEVFTHPDLQLRLWFDDGVNGIEQLTPDQPINAVGYAMMAAHVADGAVTGDAIAPGVINTVHLTNQGVATADLADGSVTTAKLADGAVTAAKLAPNSVNSSHLVNNSVTSDDIANTLALEELILGGLPFHGLLDLRGPNGHDRGALRSTGLGSELSLEYGLGLPGLLLTSRLNEGGDIDVFQANESYGVRINGDGTKSPNDSVIGGEITVHGRLGTIGVRVLGEDATGARIQVLHPNQTASIDMEGQPGRMRIRHVDGTETVLLEGDAGTTHGGRLTLSHPNGGEEQAGAILYGATDDGVGALSLRDAAGQPRFQAWGGPQGGRLTLTGIAGAAAAELQSNAGGRLTLRNEAGASRLQLFGGPAAGGLHLYGDNGEQIVSGWGTPDDDGVVTVYNRDGVDRVTLWGSHGSDDGQYGSIQIWEGPATQLVSTVVAQSNDGGEIWLMQSDGTPTVILDADHNGNGRVTTQVLEITGGSDLSESFDIAAAEGEPEPGMLVCIDSERPGELRVSNKAYDHKVAGVISGAGGVRPGMLMGQAGSIADGEHPVALTGRVYCQVDASYGAIEPGDLITSSSTPGHGMKVTESDRAHGAIVGKAMTGLSEGRGLVLLLVTLH